ncbi:amino acid adenylation domain-containing protein [Streptomyces sp. NPDC050287]|uniref:amino acid adenylation domain-containing protein n=1 Tax=Streptomyces sp. NPDC050287 TaxID=3365608 RepID=UPI00378C1631
MLYHSVRADRPGPYVEQFVFDVHGFVDVEAMKAAWDDVLRHHPVLRTRFAWEGLAEPLQTVAAEAAVPVRIRHLGDALTGQDEERFLAADRSEGFDLGKAPLMRLTWLRGDGTTTLVWSLHHLIIDGWSMPIVLRDVAAAYRARVTGGVPDLPEARPFSSFVEWMRTLPGAASAKDFWQRRLAGFSAPPPLRIRSSLSPTDVCGTSGAVVTRDLRAGLSTRTAAAARTARVTQATWYEAAWALTLSRLSGERDVVFGVTVSGRPADLHGVEGIVGPMINTLPQRIAVDEGATLRDWLRGIQRSHLDMEPHQHVGLSTLQRWTAVPAGTALFESILVFENYPGDTLRFDLGDGNALTVRQVIEDTGYPITFMVLRRPEGVRLQALYDDGMFSAGAAASLLDRVENLLEAMTAGVDGPLADIGLASPRELDLVLKEWNNTAGPLPDRPVHVMVVDRAVKAPESPALEHAGHRLTYADLLARSEDLARALVDRGAGPETVVALFQRRSPELLVSVLAVLRAGAAFVALDPANPDARLAYALEDSGAVIMLTEAAFDERLADCPVPRLLLDGPWPYGQGPLPDRTHLDSLAYITYTSGSTGRPKGIAMSHRAVANLINWQLHQSPTHHAGRTFAYASLSFDVSFQEIFGTWSAGGTLVLVTDADRRDFERLPQVAAREAVQRWYLPAAALTQIAASAAADDSVVPSLRELIPGSEPLHVTPELRRLLAAAPDCRLENQYGPSECHVVTSHVMEGPSQLMPEWPPIGRPITNTSIYLLDDMKRPVPIGATGFLHIGGICLARGYVNRPGTTAEKFVPDPFAGVPGARMYDTGDRAYQDPDGTLHLIGRMDNQVKIRGYRIELGEVETALQATGLVRETAVVVHGQETDRRLAAYVVPVDPPRDEVSFQERLRELLNTTLPEYMVPWSFTVLPHMPLTVNRKVDRKALPAPRQPVARAASIPGRPAAVLIAGMWGEALDRSVVDFDGDFFQMGGHSMLALRLIGRVRSAFGVPVGLGSLFDDRSPRRLLGRIEEHLGGADAADAVATQFLEQTESRQQR